MNAVVAVLRGVVLALLSGLRALARQALASGRLTAVGARAVAAKAGARAKAWAVTMPRKTLHFLRGKIVEVLVMLVITAGAAYFLSDAQAIRSERIACWLSDYSNEWFGAREPLAPEAGFRVLVAQLDGDADGQFTRNVVLSLNEVEGLEVRELCRSLGVPPGKAAGKGWAEADAKARAWLDDWKADVILWGMPAADDHLRLYITTPHGSGDFKLYELSKETGFLLPAAFDADFTDQVQAWVLSGLDFDPKQLLAAKYSQALVDRLPRLKALAMVKGKSPEARVSAAAVYFAAFQRVVVEGLKTSTAAPSFDDLKDVTAGLPDGIDADAKYDVWATAVVLEGMTAGLVAQTDDDVDGMRAAAEGLLRVVRHPRTDPGMAATVLDLSGTMWSYVAELSEQPGDMYRALDYLLESRRLAPPSDMSAVRATSLMSFARAVQWLARRVKDMRYLEEAAEAAARAIDLYPPDDPTGGKANARLVHADLLAGLGTVRNDAATLRRAIGAFDTALAAIPAGAWRHLHLKGIEQAAQAQRALAGITHADEDHARAIAAIEAARSAVPRAEDAQRYLQLTAERGDAMRWRGVDAGDSAPIKQAIADMKAAIADGVPRAAFREWCGMRFSIAQALLALAQFEDGAANRGEALSILRETMAQAARAGDMWIWGVAGEMRADALLTVALETGGNGALREAAQVLREVMAREVTRERAPVEWANDQFKLGVVLQHLAERERDAGAFADAEGAFRRAMAGRPREQAPALWIEAAANAGLSAARFGELARDRAAVERAIATAEDARRVPAPPGHPGAALNVRVLAMARVALARATNDAAPAMLARDEMKTVLAGLDKTSQAFDWAWTALRYGDACAAAGALAGDAAMAEEGRAVLADVRRRARELKADPLLRSVDDALAKARPIVWSR